MSSNIVLPSLSQWAKNHITTILQAAPADLDGAISSFLSDKAIIIVNGATISRDQYKTMLSGEKFDEVGSDVTFSGVVEVPADLESPVLAGSVGLFYTAVIVEALRIRDAPIESQLTVSVNLEIEQDPDTPPPPPPPIRGFSDRRRVKVLNQVMTQGPVTAQTV